MEFIKISEAVKYEKNPFLEAEVFKIDKATKQVVAGNSKDVMMNPETGEITGGSFMYKHKEVDRNQFVKIFTSEIRSLFELSTTGFKTFGYLLTCVPIGKASVYLHIPDIMEYCGYKSKKAVYRGLAELVQNNIIALSNKPNIWFINPNIIFNGDKVSFIKQYRIKDSDDEALDPLKLF